MALGLVAMLWDWYKLRTRREFLLAFHHASLRERLRWKYQRPNLLLNGWLVLAILALIAWCYFNQIFVLPALCALNAGQYFMGNRRAIQEFNAKRP